MDHLDEASFGELLQRFRKRTQLTQQALAERIGAHRSTISFWERGEYVPETLTTVLELARVLHLREDEERLLVEARFGTASILPLHNLPEQNPYFTGRQALLEMLHAALTAGEQVAPVQAQAISGLGGIGKTQLALAYAYRYRTHYHDILWALADSRETLTASYVTFAEQLRLDLRAVQEQQHIVEAVKRWLREHKGWLLILDNIEDEGLVRAFVPTPRQGAVVLTTRRAETSPVARALALDVLSEEEGTLFLLRRTGYLALGAAPAAAPPHHQAISRAIVHALGGLPLALDQAGAYIAETRCSLSEYLTLFQQEQQALLQRRGAVPSEHPESVTRTFALAFARVQHQHEAALEVLQICAFLAPEAIPLDLLRQGADELGSVLAPVAAQALAFNAALETLLAYSLVRRDAEARTLSLHRLVQAVQQETLSEPEQRLWAERAVRLVSAAFPTPEAATWERCQQLLPHALICAGHIEQWSLAFPEAASLLHQTGRYLHQRAAYEQALPLLRQAVTLREQVLGPDHPLVAQSLDILARLFHEQGQYGEALPLYQRALALREQALGPDHPDVATSLITLARLSHDQGQYTEALQLYTRALAIREQALGPVHPDIAQSLNNLALFYHDQGQYAAALPLYQRSLEIREQALGPTHPDVATGLNNLAVLYRAQGQSAEALPLLQRSLAIREQTLGPDHPDVAWSLNSLANLYHTQGHYEQALPLAERGLAIREQAFGPDHPDVAISLNTLAHLYQERGKHVQALSVAQRALAIREQALGPDHPDVPESLNILARLYEEQGQYKRALLLSQRSLAILKQALPDHPAATTTQEHVTALLLRLERTEEASTVPPAREYPNGAG